jgi:endoglucanase Acf2
MNEWAKNNKGWVNILIKTKKTTSPDQSDFYCQMDTWTPDGGNYRDKMPF